MDTRKPSTSTIDSVAALERETGIPSATLRIWERRYGFPHPQRDSRGRRCYDLAQLTKLQLVSQLIARGERPGRLLSLNTNELRAELTDAAAHLEGDALVRLLRGMDGHAIQMHLLQQLTMHGIPAFLADTLPSINQKVGRAWATGALQPFEEHLYTECVQQVLRVSLAGVPASPAGARPKVLLATFTGELHGLGLLSAHLMLANEGCACLSLGLSLAAPQIAAAAERCDADCIALSISANAPQRETLANLQLLRQRVGAKVRLWAGGSSAVLDHADLIADASFERFTSVAGLPEAVRRWRAA